MDARDFVADLTNADPAALYPTPPARAELVVTGPATVRQAGAAPGPEGAWITAQRARAEASLYFFAKVILNRGYLCPELHLPVTDFLQRRPPMRKLLLLPREHAKTTLVSHALPPHIFVQPKANNIYFPNIDGCDVRLILACETQDRGGDHLRVIRTIFESNELLKALWPARCWDRPQRDAKKWNDKELILPRNSEYPDPTLRAIGVGGAITGAHPNGIIKDDLISVEAANSSTVMETAIQWHIASRALINADDSMEWIIGTRWAVHDLYSYIMDHDPTVETICRSVVENGRCIYPVEALEPAEQSKGWTLAKVDAARAHFGIMFSLLYMNSASDPSLTDFREEQLRFFQVDGDQLTYAEDERDILIAAPPVRRADPPPPTGLVTPQTFEQLAARTDHLKLRGPRPPSAVQTLPTAAQAARPRSRWG